MNEALQERLIGYFRAALSERRVDGVLTEVSPLQFKHDHEVFEAFLRRRRNGTEVLTIGADVAGVADSEEVLRYVAAHAADGTFAALKADGSSGGELDLTVWHTLIAETVTAAAVAEVLDSLAATARRHRSRIESLVTPVSEPESSALDSEPPVFRSRDEILDDVADLVGMSIVKDEIVGIAQAARVAKKRRERGLVGQGPSPNLVFVGNPGTGKTTVARLVAELYGAIGLVPVGHLVETNRAGLVGKYLGQTAVKTEKVCESALGGVLFIDEAYTLTPSEHDDYGAEAIATLIQYMENHRGEMAVIVAGYPDEMERFLEANPGLKSRFDITVSFPDYSNDELEEIFLNLVELNQYDLTSDALKQLRISIANMMRGDGFGNAREMRKLFETVVRRQARDLEELSLAGTAQLRRIDADAFVVDHQAIRGRDEVLDDVADLVGMSSVKDEIVGIVQAARVAQKRRERGLVGDGPSPNLVFVGNPGTGKTTVARLVAELYGAIGVVPKGHLVETNRAGLVGQYTGQTAPKTEEVCRRARGGVLFIDEAYTLTQSGHRDFGGEAIATLIQYMENHRGEMAVIVAGYPDEMDRFLEANPGLKSRFDITVSFPDYSDDELEEIFLNLVEQGQYDLTPEALGQLKISIANMMRGDGFGNAREMRKLFETVVRRQAREMEQPSLAGTTMLRQIDATAFPPVANPSRLSDSPGYI